ncbi:MAG: Mur ligase family protein [Candidatus Omnitrophota bacterium]
MGRGSREGKDRLFFINMDINDVNRVCVVGWGKSGRSLCKLLLELGKKVKISEIKERSAFSTAVIDEFIDKGVEFEFGGNSDKFIKESQLVVLSPGVDTANSDACKIAKTYDIDVVGEIELSFWLTQAQVIAITGTNGKTTTSQLTRQVLKKKRKRVFLGGNIGIPFSSFVLETKKDDLVVLEISSFQLETIREFKPHVSALLNIASDHLDRYVNFSDYFDAKMNIFMNQDKNDWALINNKLDLNGIKDRVNSKVLRFSNEFSNENFSCAYKIGSIFGVSRAECDDVFRSFKGLVHRMQFVRRLRQIDFINDSKATNPTSTVWALSNVTSSVLLIAGGKDKGLDFSEIIPHLDKVKKVFLFGEASVKIKNEISPYVKTEVFTSLRDSVNKSFQEATASDVILLSPMCSSYDMFTDYVDRGNRFIEIVNNL